jgi:hypothetical protein
MYVENDEINITRKLGSRSSPKNNKIIIITITTNSGIIITSIIVLAVIIIAIRQSVWYKSNNEALLCNLCWRGKSMCHLF